MNRPALHGRAESSPLRPAVAYLRASTKRQDLSCDDQLRAIESYCSARGLDLVRTYRDDGRSAWNRGRESREAWNEMLSDLEAGARVDVVVVWSLKRWARSTRHGLLAAWAVADLEVEWHSTDTGRINLDTTEGQIMASAMLALAEQESRDKSRIVRERKAAHRGDGYWVTRPPYGYQTTGPKGRKTLTPAPHESDVVLRIYAEYDAGLSPAAIAGRLNRDGLTSRHGRAWSPSSVQTILAGWSYGGAWRSKGTGAVLPMRVETFVPRAQWERCRARAEAKGGRRGRRPRYPLSGLVLCGGCGRTMRAHCWPTRSGGVRRAYRCPGRETKECGNPVLPRIEQLEAAVMAWWREIADSADAYSLAHDVVSQAHREALDAQASRRPIDREREDLDRQEMHLVDSVRIDGPSPIVSRELARVRARRAELDVLAEQLGAVVVPIDVDALAREIVEEARSVESPAQLRDWLESITVEPNRTVVIRGFGREGVFDA